MTTFKSAITICGLSQKEAANYLDVSISSVKDWSRGKSAPPIGIWEMMAKLYSRIKNASDHTSSLLDPDIMDRAAMNNITADNGEYPMPEDAVSAAGAMALLAAINDTRPASNSRP